MKRFLLLALSLFSFSILFFSCQKDNVPKTKTELLTNNSQKIWKMNSWKANPPEIITDFISGNRIEITDFFNFYPNYVKDNLWVFKSDKTYNIEEGATKGSITSKQIINTGFWAFNSTETTLTFPNDVLVGFQFGFNVSLDHYVKELTIISLTENELIFSCVVFYYLPSTASKKYITYTIALVPY